MAGDVWTTRHVRGREGQIGNVEYPCVVDQVFWPFGPSLWFLSLGESHKIFIILLISMLFNGRNNFRDIKML